MVKNKKHIKNTKINIGELLSSHKILPVSLNFYNNDNNCNSNNYNNDDKNKLTNINKSSKFSNNKFNECNICFENIENLFPMRCCNNSKLICHSCLCNSYLKKPNCPFCRKNIIENTIIISCYRNCCDNCGDEIKITSSCFKCKLLFGNNTNNILKKKYIKVKVNKLNVDYKTYINIINNEYDLSYNQSSILKCNRFRLNNNRTIEYYYGNGNFKKFNNNNYIPMWYPMTEYINSLIN